MDVENPCEGCEVVVIGVYFGSLKCSLGVGEDAQLLNRSMEMRVWNLEGAGGSGDSPFVSHVSVWAFCFVRCFVFLARGAAVA